MGFILHYNDFVLFISVESVMEILRGLFIEDEAVRFSFVRARGPGGQNVNKVSTAVLLRFDVEKSGLAVEVQERLSVIAKNKLNQVGELIIKAEEFRTQIKNRHAALGKLRGLLQQALYKPKKRKKTKPTLGSVERRLSEKKLRGKNKSLRRKRVSLSGD